MRRVGLPPSEVFARLSEAGLDSVPGTAAEVLHDGVRQLISPNKLPVARWVEIIEAAHAIGLRSTVDGHVRPHRDSRGAGRAHRASRELQERTGGFTEFVPLSSSRSTRCSAARTGSRRSRARRTSSTPRCSACALGRTITNLQASWVKMGLDAATEALHWGVNDLGGTLMEESISRMAGSYYGVRLDPEDLIGAAHGAGRPAAERTTLYGDPPALPGGRPDGRSRPRTHEPLGQHRRGHGLGGDRRPCEVEVRAGGTASARSRSRATTTRSSSSRACPSSTHAVRGAAGRRARVARAGQRLPAERAAHARRAGPRGSSSAPADVRVSARPAVHAAPRTSTTRGREVDALARWRTAWRSSDPAELAPHAAPARRPGLRRRGVARHARVHPLAPRSRAGRRARRDRRLRGVHAPLLRGLGRPGRSAGCSPRCPRR